MVLDLNSQQKPGSHRNICLLLLLWFKMVIFPITKFSVREGFREEFALLVEQMIFFKRSIQVMLVWKHLKIFDETPLSPGAFPKLILNIALETSADVLIFTSSNFLFFFFCYYSAFI